MRTRWTCTPAVACELLLLVGCGSRTTRLVAELQDPDPAIRCAAARALGDAPGDAATIVPALAAACGDEELEVRERACESLGQFGPAAEAGLVALEQALKDGQRPVCLAAAMAILRVAPGHEAAEDVVGHALRSGDGPVFLAVGRMGTDAAWATPTLVALLSDSRPAIRALAAHTLGEVGVADDRVFAALTRSQGDRRPAVRDAATRALAEIRSRPHTKNP